MPEDPSRPPGLRASDADRDRTLELLRAAVADGRLDPQEFDERVDATLTSRTREALAAITTDLVEGAAPGRVGGPAGAAVAVPAPARGTPDRLTIKGKHGAVRREGRWTLPRRLRVRTAWSAVTIDLTEATLSGPELAVELRVRGGSVELVLAPGMVVDANGVATKFAVVDVGRAPEDVPETLYIRLLGRIKHGGVSARWQTPRR